MIALNIKCFFGYFYRSNSMYNVYVQEDIDFFGRLKQTWCVFRKFSILILNTIVSFFSNVFSNFSNYWNEWYECEIHLFSFYKSLLLPEIVETRYLRSKNCFRWHIMYNIEEKKNCFFKQISLESFFFFENLNLLPLGRLFQSRTYFYLRFQ